MEKRELIIGEVHINDESDCYVIAEIGHNHQGKLEIAREMIKRARECGAHAVKLQKRDNKNLYTKEMYNKPYDNENSFGATYGEHRETLEFNRVEYRELQAYARELGITFFATPFDFASVDFLEALDIPVYKIASGDLRNIPLLTYVANTGKPLLVSTGAANIEDVQRAYDAVMPINNKLCIMQCTSIYPAGAETMNLRVIETYRSLFPDSVIGVSDHQNGIAMTLLAYALGARIVEKHFTMNRAMKGTDHAFSLEPEGLRKMIRDLQRGRAAMGNGVKEIHPEEKKALTKMGKKLVAARDLPAGHILAVEDIAIKSPGDGISPDKMNDIIGQQLCCVLKEGEVLSYAVISPTGKAIKDRMISGRYETTPPAIGTTPLLRGKYNCKIR